MVWIRVCWNRGSLLKWISRNLIDGRGWREESKGKGRDTYAKNIPPAPRMTGSMTKAPNLRPSSWTSLVIVLVIYSAYLDPFLFSRLKISSREEKVWVSPKESSCPGGASTIHFPFFNLTSGKSNQSVPLLVFFFDWPSYVNGESTHSHVVHTTQ